MSTLIRIEHLSKQYGRKFAVKDLNLHIEKGTTFGLIGSNGAGKSTTMKILATLIRPSSGRAWVGGYDVTKSGRKVREIVGYMPDFFGVYDQLTSIEYLDFYAACYGFDYATRRQVAMQLLELVDLTDQSDQPVDHLSRGMKQRLGLARALVHDPAFLILDEPASGLDPRSRMEFRKILKVLRSMGKTILISSHMLSELEEICDAIGVMEQGELIACEQVDALKHVRRSERIYEIYVRDKVEETVQLLQALQEVESVTVEERKLFVQTKMGEQSQDQLLSMLVEHQIPVLQFQERSINMEDLYLQVTNRSQGGNTDDQKVE